jgi:hypothetical protein
VAARAEMPVAITSTGVFGCIWENAMCRYGHTYPAGPYPSDFVIDSFNKRG